MLLSESIFLTMVLAVRIQMKPNTFCSRPAAALILMSPETYSARYTYVSITWVTGYRAPLFMGTE